MKHKYKVGDRVLVSETSDQIQDDHNRTMWIGLGKGRGMVTRIDEHDDQLPYAVHLLDSKDQKTESWEWFSEDDLSPGGAPVSEDEVAQAIASITGKAPAPTEDDEAFARGYSSGYIAALRAVKELLVKYDTDAINAYELLDELRTLR